MDCRRARAAGCALVLAASCGCAASAQGVAPSQLRPAEHAAYVLPDGSVQVITCAAMVGVVRALNQLFTAAHPGVSFSVLVGDNYSAMAALTFDRTAFAPLGTEYTRIGLGDNLKIAAEPVGFRIAHATLTPGPGVPALGVIVNAANPVSAVSMSQLTRIFAVGAPSGDIATWSQAGIAGPLAGREVHPVGPLTSDYLDSDDPQVGEFLSTDKMNGLNMNHRYVALGHYTEVVQRVSEDPAAIGITALNIPLGAAKVIAVKSAETSPARAADATHIAAGQYPLDRFIYIYLRVGKSTPMDDFGKEYVRMALSAEGQRAIAGEAAGYLPLNEGELAEERGKLQR